MLKTKKHIEAITMPKRHHLKVQKGIYLLPSFFTSCSLFCGFYAVISAINATDNSGFFKAAIATIAAAFFDSLDGRAARLTNTTSKFGMEYDSLADLMAFGLSPAIFMYMWGLRDFGKAGFMGCFLFAACGALRLARFNSIASKGDYRYFLGLPIPAAAGMVAATFILCDAFFPDLRGNTYPMLGLSYFLSFLMVSNIKFRSFKDVDIKKRKPFGLLIMLICFFALLTWQPEILLFGTGVLYIGSNVIGEIGRFKKKRMAPAPQLVSVTSPEDSAADDKQ